MKSSPEVYSSNLQFTLNVNCAKLIYIIAHVIPSYYYNANSCDVAESIFIFIYTYILRSSYISFKLMVFRYYVWELGLDIYLRMIICARENQAILLQKRLILNQALSLSRCLDYQLLFNCSNNYPDLETIRWFTTLIMTTAEPNKANNWNRGNPYSSTRVYKDHFLISEY